MKRSGATYICTELAREYGVTDLAGNSPPSLRDKRGAPIYGPIG